MRIREELINLRETDLYSLILFSLFKLRDIPEYSSLSELCYILDKESLLKLCEYFGGTTIRIPKIEELSSIVYSLVLYQLVDIDKTEYEEAVKLLGEKSCNLRQVKSDYLKLKEILSNYEFKRRYDD